MKSPWLPLVLLGLPLLAAAQKKPLDHSVYDDWKSVGTSLLSPDGNAIAYEVNPQEGDGILHIRTFGKAGRQTEIPRGYRAAFSEDGKTAVCLVKAPFADTRQARIKKKTGDDLPADSLAVVDLGSGTVRRFPQVRSYSFGKHAGGAVAWLSRDTTLIPREERKKKDAGYPLLIYHFETGSTDTLRHVDQVGTDKAGRTFAFVRKQGKNSRVGFYDVATRRSTLLADSSRFHSLPVFSEDGTRALFLQSADTLASGSKHCALYEYDLAHAQLACRLADAGAEGIPEGWGLTENARPRFSHDGTRIFAGLQAWRAPDDTSRVPFETAGLDIWNWDAPELPPMTKKNLKRDLEKTCPAVISGGKAILLTQDKFDQILLPDRGDAAHALSMDRSEAVLPSQWDIQSPFRLSIVDLGTGARTRIAEGRFEQVSASPGGRYVLYFDLVQHNWMLYDVATRKTRDLTGRLGVPFWDEEDDHPMLPEPYGVAGWTREDDSVLLYDRYDIWQIDTRTGKAVNLTDGRADGLTFRYMNTHDPEEEPFIGPDETLILSRFDNQTKERGLCAADLGHIGKKDALRTLAEGGFTWDRLQKARLADVWLFRKGNFRHPMDLYAIRKPFKEAEKLTGLEGQLEPYTWGTPELFRWNAYDGTPLDGLVYKPDGFDPERRYPVLIYFYEKNSENLYSWYNVAPSRSIINIPFYVSRGYVVFVPDIVYTSGLPGESAYNCIVSGAEALAARPWADGDNMAIQGQSWGGYQVAWLITRTNRFKAAGAGAPVANMTSAYGGIRWASGMSRQFQYEQTQSRIGRDLWNGTELYLENSPLFKLPNVTTPVLIMHNDNDGAVPWYQGIELFMGLRRLGKPAWLLEYNGEEHNLVERRNCKDLSIRLQQFFDHYLKGEPMPAWMKTGVPTDRKGEYFGFEPAR